MALRVLPAVAIAADGAEGGWQPAVQVGADDRIRIVLTLTRYPPPLWWFPGSDQVSQLSIVAPEERATLHAAAPRAATLRAVTLRITRLSEVVTPREVELVYPHRPERFLQPGVYALEYSCAVTDTNNV